MNALVKGHQGLNAALSFPLTTMHEYQNTKIQLQPFNPNYSSYYIYMITAPAFDSRIAKNYHILL
jgi:hypothetical protein